MKSVKQKREEAQSRAVNYSWENSKACRTGSKTKEQWEAKNKALVK